MDLVIAIPEAFVYACVAARGKAKKYKIPVKSQNPGFAQKEIPPYNQSTQAGSKP